MGERTFGTQLSHYWVLLTQCVQHTVCQKFWVWWERGIWGVQRLLTLVKVVKDFDISIVESLLEVFRPDTSRRRLSPCPWSLPLSPWNAILEIYNFLIGCPLPKSKCLGALGDLKNEAYGPECYYLATNSNKYTRIPEINNFLTKWKTTVHSGKKYGQG